MRDVMLTGGVICAVAGLALSLWLLAEERKKK